MSDDLIKRLDAIKAVIKVDDYGDGIGFEVKSHCLVELELVPSADRPQGEWIEQEDCWQCSECGDEYVLEVDVKPIDARMYFCPNCGAKMDGERKESE